MAFNIVFQSGICCLLIFGLVLVCIKTFRRPLDFRIPSFKYRYWSILGSIGILNLIFTQSRQTSLKLSIYLLQIASGLSVIFQREDLYVFWIIFHPFIALNNVSLVEQFLSSNKFLDKASSYKVMHPWLGRGLLTSSGSRWRKRRKLLTPSFHFEILKDFQLIFDKQAKVFVDILKTQCDKDWIDIRHCVTLCSLDIIVESTLGVKIGAQVNRNAEYVQSVLRVTESFIYRIFIPLYWNDFIYNLLPVGKQISKDISALHEFSRKVIKEKKSAIFMQNERAAEMVQNGIADDIKSSMFRRRKRKVLIDLLLDVHLSNPELTEEDIREEIDTFVFEGHDTTAVGLMWTLYLVGLYPDVQAKVHEEQDQIFGDDTEREVTIDDLKRMNYLECVLKESHRIFPPVPIIARDTEEDEKFCGYHLKKGSTMVVIPYVLHRDPNTFPDPEKFNPSRFFPEHSFGRNAYAYIPFSAGPRNCIGQRFAMMEEKTVVSHVLRNFHLRSLEPRDRVFSSAEIILRSPYPLKIKFSKRF